MSKLYTPIQINGELFNPVTPKDLELYERELYIDREGNLYFGNASGAATQINANKAKEAALAYNLGNEESFFQFDNVSKAARIADIKITSNGKIEGNNTAINAFTITNSALNNSNISGLQNLILSANMWGTALPTTNLEHGRVFFLVNE